MTKDEAIEQAVHDFENKENHLDGYKPEVKIENGCVYVCFPEAGEAYAINKNNKLCPANDPGDEIENVARSDYYMTYHEEPWDDGSLDHLDKKETQQ